MEKLVDVRTKAEWDEGHIKGALHFDLSRLNAGELPDLPKDTELKLYCRSGARASIAEQILTSAGFSKVTNLGGITNLISEGLEIEKS
jgi:rhodanese-related sulfurtransferase